MFQYDCRRQAVILPGERYQRLTRLWLYAGGVNDGKAAGAQTCIRNEVEHCKSVGRCGLVGGVIGIPSLDMRPKTTTSVGLKCLEAKEDFPDPVGPISATRHSSGMAIFIG